MDHNQEEVGANNAIVKGKRTKRHRPQSPVPFRVTTPSATSSESAATAPVPTTATSSDHHRLHLNTEEEEDMANCLIMLAQGRRFEKFTSRRFLESSPSLGVSTTASGGGGGGYYVYECKTCSRTFPSFQALGGHRASHKKPKLAAATKDEESRSTRRSNNNNNNNHLVLLSDEDETAATNTAMITNNFASSTSPPHPLSLQLTNRALCTTASTPMTPAGQKAARVHECSICGAEFASGQALGGHMRRHRGPTAPGGSQTALTLHDDHEKRSPSTSSAVEPTSHAKKPSLDLDLNLPAMPDAEEVNVSSSSEPKLAFAGKQSAPEGQKQPIVFSPPPALVDCHY